MLGIIALVLFILWLGGAFAFHITLAAMNILWVVALVLVIIVLYQNVRDRRL